MESLAEMQRDYPIVIRVPACPMYALVLRERRIEPKRFPLDLLRRITVADALLVCQMDTSLYFRTVT